MVSGVNPVSMGGQYGGSSDVQVAQGMVKTLLQNLSSIGSGQGEPQLQKNLLAELNDNLSQSPAMTSLYQIVNQMNSGNELASISTMLTNLSNLDPKLSLEYCPAGSNNTVPLLPLTGDSKTMQDNIAQVICNYAIDSTPSGADMKGAQNALNNYINSPTADNFDAFTNIVNQYLNA